MADSSQSKHWTFFSLRFYTRSLIIPCRSLLCHTSNHLTMHCRESAILYNIYSTIYIICYAIPYHIEWVMSRSWMDAFYMQPLKINVDEATVRMVSATLQTKSDREDMMKNIFQSSRIFAQNEINDHLTDFRSKRALGATRSAVYYDHCTLKWCNVTLWTSISAVNRNP